MSQYVVIIKEEAQEDLKRLLRNEPKAYKKALRFIAELYDHPKTGLGHPEPLKGKPEGRWSREITKKHRLVYRIFDTEVYVEVLTAYFVEIIKGSLPCNSNTANYLSADTCSTLVKV